MIIIFSREILLQIYQRDVSPLVNIKFFLYKLYCVKSFIYVINNTFESTCAKRT